MTTDGLSLLATVILLFPMTYFLIASLTFFLARLDDPVVTWLLRGLFNTYFLAVAAACGLATAAFAWAGRPLVAFGLGLLAGFGIAARRWFLDRMDAGLRARDAGDPSAVGRLRRLHVGGILYNAVQYVAVIASVPFLLGSPL